MEQTWTASAGTPGMSPPALTLEAVARHAVVALIALDPRCRIVQANPAAADLAHRAAHDLLGLRFCEAYGGRAPARCGGSACQFARTLAGHERRTHPRWSTLTIDATAVSALVRGVTVFAPAAGRHAAAGAVVTIIPGSMVDQADHRYRELMAEGLHEFRHLVTLQTVAVDMLAGAGGDWPAVAGAALAALRRSTLNVAEYLETLYSRTLFGLEALAFTPRLTALRPVIDAVVERLAATLQRRQQTVRVAVHPGLQAWVDPVALGHVLVNFLLNAHAYSIEGDRFIVAARRIQRLGMIEITVRDHGPGVPPAERRRIFERYYRGARPPEEQGSGLGLAIVQSIARQHGGTVGVRSADGPGAVFWIRLHAAPPGAGTDASAR